MRAPPSRGMRTCSARSRSGSRRRRAARRSRRRRPPATPGRIRRRTAGRARWAWRPVTSCGDSLRIRVYDAREMTELPAGTVTFVFTDLEGSTALVKELGETYGEVLAQHRRIVRDI